MRIDIVDDRPEAVEDYKHADDGEYYVPRQCEKGVEPAQINEN